MVAYRKLITYYPETRELYFADRIG